MLICVCVGVQLGYIDWCLISLSLFSLSPSLPFSPSLPSFFPANEFGLFKPDEDPTKGRWLEQGRTLEYYDLKSGDMLQYRKKLRPLRVRTLDGSVKTLLVDDSQTVAELIKAVCARIGKTTARVNQLSSLPLLCVCNWIWYC